MPTPDGKLTFRIPPKSFDTHHYRHFYEAIEASADAVVVTDPGVTVDFSFYGGRAHKCIWLFHCDPHGAPHDIPIESLMSESMRAMVREINGEAALAMLEGPDIERLKCLNPNSALPSIDRSDAITCLLCAQPFGRLEERFVNGGSFIIVPTSVPESLFYTDFSETRFIDVYMLGVTTHRYYPLRMLMQKTLRQYSQEGADYPRSDIHFYRGQAPKVSPDDREFKADYKLFDVHQKWYADCMRHSKIFPFCGGIYNHPIAKFFEASACGCLIMAPVPNSADDLGFVDGETMVAIDHHNFMDKIRYYLDHDDERMRIVRNAHALNQVNYTCSAAVKNMIAKLRQIIADVPAREISRRYAPWRL